MQDADYRRLVEDSPIATFLVRAGRRDPDRTLLWASTAALELLGRGAGEVLGRPLEEFVHPADREDVAALLAAQAPAQRGALEWRMLRAGGGTATVEVLTAAVVTSGEGGEDVLSLSCWDVSRHVERTRDLTHRATHDLLTDLPDRGLLEDRWAQARSRARRSGVAPVVAFCDVDDLKRVNDRHGHAAGDAALVAVAARLRSAARGEDTVARFGGDEFIVLVEAADVEPEVLAARLREATAAVPVQLPDGTSTSLSCSVGLVVDDLARSSAEVLAEADRRMYEDKRRPR
ncbi:diguanylate cyclase [Kineococcus sp. T13]|uniref:diguanylate cyclase domain-containing protein n=1 Tax=Kineococcus vitellinus TaxID=2696565 RepID=UPI001412BA4F|nr:diguanylate cyclase [Kineococcus vitellinus]